MSALDFTARALALRATALTPLTFGELQQAQLPGTVTRVVSSGHAEPGSGAAAYVCDQQFSAALQDDFPAAVFRESGGRTFRLSWDERGSITPEQFGWTEAETHTGKIITDAFRYQVECGGSGTVELTPGRRYAMSNHASPAINDPAVPHTLRGRSFLRPGNHLRGNGATLEGAHAFGYALVSAYSEMRSIHEVTGPMAAGQRVFQLAAVSEAAQFEVGDDVLWRLGEATTGVDAIEPLTWGWAKVAAIDTVTGRVTLDRGLPRAWDGASPNNYGKSLRRMIPLSGLVYDNVTFASPSSSEPITYGGRIYAARDVRVTFARGRGCGAGTLVLQYVQNFHIGYCEGAENGYKPLPGLTSGGRGISIAESTGRIEHLAVSDCYMTGAYIEFNSDVTIGFFHDIVSNSDDGTGGTARHKGIYANWGSRVHVERALFEGGSNFYTHESAAATGGRVTFGDVRVVCSGAPFVLPAPGYDCDRLSLSINGAEELYIGSRARWVEQTIFLTDGMTFAAGRMDFGYGLVVACHAVFGGGAVAADFSNFYVGRVSHALDLKTTLVPAAPTTTEVNLITAYAYGVYVAGAVKPQFGAGSGLANWGDRAEPALVRIVTPAGSSLAGSGKYVRVRMLIVPNELAAAGTVTTAMIAREAQDMVYEGQAASSALNTSIAPGTTVSQTVAITGLAAGDLADASFSASLNAGLMMTVQAVTNGVKVSLTNAIATAVAGPSGTIYAQGRKRRSGL
jgi:hypothetical protein